MLSQIELGNSQPTVRVLLRIAHALSVPISTVMGRGDTVEPFVLRAARERLVIDPAHDIGRKALFPKGASRVVEFYELRFGRKCSELAEAREPKTTENIVVLSGCLEISVDERRMTLQPGDAAFYLADKRREYRNIGRTRVLAYLVVSRDIRSLVSP